MEFPLTHPEFFEDIGIAPPKGVILYGPPGTGAVAVAVAVAAAAAAVLLAVAAAVFVVVGAAVSAAVAAAVSLAGASALGDAKAWGAHRAAAAAAVAEATAVVAAAIAPRAEGAAEGAARAAAGTAAARALWINACMRMRVFIISGKTLLAKAVANETSATFLRVVGSELIQKYLGDGPKLVREMFKLAKEHAPSIVFIDEIDAVGTKR